MAKYYRVTEAQLQKIFENLEMKRLSEMDNYAPGSDTSRAPWNQTDPKMSSPMTKAGDYKLVSIARDQYLIHNPRTNELLYTMDEVWDDGSVDIKDRLEDFLEIPQERYDDEGGTYMGNTEDWKGSIDSNDIANSLVNYLNFKGDKNGEVGIVDVERWLDGDGLFLLVTPESIGEIYDETLKAKASEILGLS